ncbi:MAG: hypothetical protein IJP17_01580 [Clostridia bacterium]|nr:hypothetical protein [Clostridia bacterium]
MGMYRFSTHDDTEVFVATNDSTTWAQIVLPFAVPLLLTFCFGTYTAHFISEHPIISLLIYLALSVCAGWIIYRRGMRYPLAGVVATVLMLLPFGIFQGRYALPLMMNPSFDDGLNWVIATFIVGGLTIFIISLCKLKRNGIKHLITSGIMWVILLLLKPYL